MSEWFKEAVLKTVSQQWLVGSNPTISAILGIWLRAWFQAFLFQNAEFAQQNISLKRYHFAEVLKW